MLGGQAGNRAVIGGVGGPGLGDRVGRQDVSVPHMIAEAYPVPVHASSGP